MRKPAFALAPEKKRQFDELGFCIVPNLFSEFELQEIEDLFRDYRRSMQTESREQDGELMDQGQRTAVGGQHATRDMVKAVRITPSTLAGDLPWNQKVRSWFLHPNIAAVLEALFGKPALGAHVMYYYKPPGADGQGMHQDNFYIVARPATCIAAWSPIDSADLENGCLWVIPGSHLGPIHCPEPGGEKWMNYQDTHITKFPAGQEPVPLPVKRGETLFFGGNLIHGSGPNRTTDRYRRTLVCHYIDAASEQIGDYYHPVLNMHGDVASQVELLKDGGPCGEQARHDAMDHGRRPVSPGNLKKLSESNEAGR